MEWILYVLLALAVAGDILLAVILAVLQKNNETQQKIDTADDFVRAMTPVLQSETDLLAEQLRAITRKLESVQQLDPDAAAELLGIEE